MNNLINKNMFKKILFFMLAMIAGLSFSSCNKDLGRDQKFVEVTLNYRLVEENSMYATKAMTNEEVLLDIQPGKFYKLHPAALGSSGPVVGIGFPTFEEGTVKDE